MKCELCGSAFVKGNGSVISTEEDGEIGICPSCHDDIFQDYARIDIDVMIVPVSEESFKMAIEKKKYICPSRYMRKRRKPKFIAFYRGGEIGAITHIAKVENAAFNVPASKVTKFSDSRNWPDWMAKRLISIFNLSKPLSLKYKIVRNDSPAIQNRVYKTFNEFVTAKKLKDLHRRSQ